MKNNRTIFDQLFKIVDPKLKSYRNDLIKYDFKFISELGPGERFLHITRESGTAFFFLDPSEDNNKIIENDCYFFNYRIENGCKCIVFFDGSEVKKITADKAKKIFFNTIDQRINKLTKNQPGTLI